MMTKYEVCVCKGDKSQRYLYTTILTLAEIGNLLDCGLVLYSAIQESDDVRLDPLYQCDGCGDMFLGSDLVPSKNLHQRLNFPVGHPACIEPAGDCSQCGAFAYAHEAHSADVTEPVALVAQAVEQQIHLPLRLEPCQDDHGESTVIMDAKGFTVAVINSAVWNPDAQLENPQDRAYAALILQAANGTATPVVAATRHYSLSLTSMGLDSEEHDSEQARQDWFDKQRPYADDHYFLDISRDGELLDYGLGDVGERYDDDDDDEQR